MEEKKLVKPKDTIVMPAVTPQEAVIKWQQYQELKEKICDIKNDVQKIQGKDFLKKSYWRKLATFFNLSVEIVEEKSETLTRYGNEVLVYHFRARATAPNGRFAEGTGSCDIYDHANIRDGKFVIGKENKEAEPKPIHNARTTAETRAWNRAVSNLVGGGEVSAEEVASVENGDRYYSKGNNTATTRQKGTPSQIKYALQLAQQIGDTIIGESQFAAMSKQDINEYIRNAKAELAIRQQ